ncbi:MAG: flavodoxin family protein [Treponema sp.]|nr:flavodoxin family protein [Treponema sp.]
MKKILVINGSGRKAGNAAGLAATAVEAAQKAGGEAKVYNLVEMNIRPCAACNGCKTGNVGCVQKDDISPLIEEILDSDGILVSSPIYFGRATAQIYTWIGRLFSLLGPGGSRAAKKDRKLGVILSFNSGPAEVYAKEGEYLTTGGPNMALGATAHQVLLAGGLGDKEAYKTRGDYLDQARALGEWLIA